MHRRAPGGRAAANVLIGTGERLCLGGLTSARSKVASTKAKVHRVREDSKVAGKRRAESAAFSVARRDITLPAQEVEALSRVLFPATARRQNRLTLEQLQKPPL